MTDKIFEFRTVDDFLQMSEEQFERFLPDFIHWFAIRKAFMDIRQATFEGLDAVVLINPEPVIKWKDDGKIGGEDYEVTIRRHHNGENDIKIKVRKER